MALKPETQAHLARAERNRTVARALCDPQQTPTITPPPLEWAAVAAFYAAVHYVHAFLWERLGQNPTDHPMRRRCVAQIAPLKAVVGEYDILSDLAYQARYPRTFQPLAGVVRQGVNQALEAIRRVVCQDLGVPTP